MRRQRARAGLNLESGLSLVELLIAMTIGLLLLAGLTLIFVNSSEANRELQKTAQQIENGRYASDILNQDLHHAGFYGRQYQFQEPAAPFNPDPCELTNLTVLRNALNRPVQGYRAVDLATRAPVSATTTCDDKGLLTDANLQPGSDVLVIRRASTKALGTTLVGPQTFELTEASVSQELYIQSTGRWSDTDSPKLLVGTDAVLPPLADTLPAGSLLKDTMGNPAPVRKYVVHVYFVAPCSVAAAANGVCAAGDDAIPTLKRLELVSEGGVRSMKIVPLVEGIEYMKIEYGIDNVRLAPCAVPNPDGTCSATGQFGDSVVDSYSPTPGNWTEVVAARIFLLARNVEPTTGFVDDKTYELGRSPSVVVTPGGGFRRHAYVSEVALLNVAGRREIP